MRAGFIMIFTMVAVAVSGYLLVESAPDFSNYALLSRSQELDDSLTELRRSLASQPYSLYTTLGDPEFPSQEQFLLERFGALSILPRGSDTTPGHPPRGPEQSERPSFLSTVPRDPYIPIAQWYDPSTGQGDYWRVSYNLVRDSTFAPAARREAYDEDSHDIYFTLVPSSGRSSIWRVGRLGIPRPSGALISDPDFDIREPAVSPDGSRLAFVRKRTGNSEIWTANAADGQLRTKITSGSSQIFDTPRWTPLGDQVLYRNAVTRIFEVKGLSERTRAYRFPFGMEDVGSPSWSPTGEYLAYVAKAGGEYRLGLTDFSAYRRRWNESDGNDSYADQQNAESTSRVIDPSLILLSKLSKRLPAKPVAVAWSPKSPEGAPSGEATGSEFVYVADDGSPNGALKLVDVKRQTITDVPDAGAAGAGFVKWLHPAAQGSTRLTTASWLLVARARGTGSSPGLFRRRIGNGTPSLEFPVADQSTAPEAANLSDVTSMAVSVQATHAMFPSATGRMLLSCAIDGADTGLGRLATVAQLEAGRLETPTAGPVRSYWSYPPANVTTINSSKSGKFDADNWRAFVRASQDFDGDNKLGAQWIRVEPTAMPDRLLFDNGHSTFLARRDSPNIPEKVITGLVEPSWSPRGLTGAGRESQNSLGRPVDVRRMVIGQLSATAVRITTGLDPALSPDDRFIVSSQNRGATSTFPPERWTYPIENMDLWRDDTDASNPKNLTPDTPDSQEREPAWSPDGRYIYYQREIQEAPSLATHGSSIYRVTVDGAVQTEVQPMTPPQSPIPGVTTRIEYYSPAVSPDGTRLAIIGRERLRASVGGLGDSGDIISEALYVKDLITGSDPKAILRFAHKEHPIYKSDGNYSSEGAWSLDSPGWSPDGEEIILVRIQDHLERANVKYPKQHIYNWDPRGDKVPYFRDLRNPDGSKSSGEQEILRVLAADPSQLPVKRALAKNYDVLVSTIPGSPSLLRLTGSEDEFGSKGKRNARLFHPRLAPGAMVFQRILKSEAQSTGIGVSLANSWYVLSGFVRTSSGTQDIHAAQIMLQVMDGSGLLVDLSRSDPPSFRVGIVDVGGSQWTRFSQAINFGTLASTGPYTLNLILFSLGGVGSYADFTGLKLEKAFDTEKLYPTRFGLGYSVFSPNRESDPRLPEGAFFER